MEPLIKEILADLYRIDPELKSREAELAKLVSRLLASRPDTDLDENFRQELRERLLAEFSASRQEKSPLSAKLARLFMTNKLGLAAGGALAVMILAAALIYSPAGTTPASPTTSDRALALGLSVRAGGDNAFGPLGLTSDGSLNDARARQPNAVSAPSTASAAPEAAPLGLGGGGGALGLKMAAPDMMPAYEQPTRYRFNYAGELPAPEDKVEILKRDISFDTGAIAGIFSGLDLGLMNLGGLSDLAVQNVSLTEDRDLGYQVSLNFEDGSITINQNWSRWPQAKMDCSSDQGCSPQRVRQEDIPADEDLLRIAAEFVDRMGIPAGNYAAPKVDGSWRRWYAEAEDKENYWFPEQVSVNYPMLVNGKKVYYNDGREAGLSLSIDVRTKRISNVSPIYSQRYISSGYAGETDVSRILKVASDGGIMPIYYGGEGAREIQIGIGEPELAYYWHWNYQNGRSESLLVPALIFPVDNAADDRGLYLEKVVVPLAKEILDQAGQNEGPTPYLMRGGGAAPVAEPAAATTEPAMVK